MTTVVKDGVTETLYVNGAQVKQVTVADGVLDGIGTDPTGRLGKATWTETYFSGDIMEVLVYTNALSGADLTSLHTYLNDKYFTNGTAAVSIVSPTNNASYSAPRSITIVADTTGTVGTITNVAFYDGSTLIGNKTFAPYAFTLANVSVGDHVLTAIATIAGGAFAVSTAKTVNVTAGSGGPTFNGLGMWYRADEGVVKDPANPSGVLLWADQSGGGVDASQVASASQPTLITSGTGRPGLHFNGGGQHMNFTFPVGGLTGFSIVLVSAKYPQQTGAVIGGPPENSVTIAWPEDQQFGNWDGLYLSSFQTNLYWRMGTFEVPNGYVYARPTSVGAAATTTVLIKDGFTETLYTDGVQAKQITAAENTLAGMPYTHDAGYLARAGASSTYFAGDIMEVLVYTNALSSGAQADIQNYLHAKYFANLPPTVTVLSPTNNQVFSTPGNVTLLADPADDGTVAKVEFFDSTTLVGTRTSAPWSVTWTNPPVGGHVLTAKATDNQGATGLSAPVTFFVYPASGFFMVDNFETRTVGGISGQGGWSSLYSTVNVDATDPNNKVLGSPLNNDVTYFPVLLPQGSTGTLFMRLYSQNINPDTQNGDNIYWGLSDVAAPVSAADFEVEMARKTSAGGTPLGMGENIGNRPLLGPNTLTNFVAFTWYKLWLVVDNSADTYKVYMQGGDLAQPTLLIGDSYYETNPFIFRGGVAANDLVTFLIITSAHQPTAAFQFDDLYMALGENLSDPLPRPVLSITKSAGNVVVSWPASASGYGLEFSPSLPATIWSPVTNTPVGAGDQMTVTLPVSEAPKYLRLKK
jgi:hypothetical protein